MVMVMFMNAFVFTLLFRFYPSDFLIRTELSLWYVLPCVLQLYSFPPICGLPRLEGVKNHGLCWGSRLSGRKLEQAGKAAGTLYYWG